MLHQTCEGIALCEITGTYRFACSGGKKNLINWSQHMKITDRRENAEVDVRIISTAERGQSG
jgi:hypothetical protein